MKTGHGRCWSCLGQVKVNISYQSEWNISLILDKIYECDLCILAMGFVGPEKVVHSPLCLNSAHSAS